MRLPKTPVLLFILFMSLSGRGFSQQTPADDPPTAAPQDISGNETVTAPLTAATNPKSKEPTTGTLLEYADPDLKEQQHWLPVGNRQISSLYLSQTGGKTYGGALLIPNLNTPPSQRGIINSLRNALPESHWNTLAIDLSNKEPLSEQFVSQSIAAGLKFLNEKGIYNLAMIAEGVGAAQAIHFLTDSSSADDVMLQSVRALIIIYPNNNVPGSDVKTLEKLSTIEIPVLDAYSANDYSQRELASSRKKAIHNTPAQPAYRQITLPNQVNYYRKHENHITQRIRGWMDKHISGFTVEKKRQ